MGMIKVKVSLCGEYQRKSDFGVHKDYSHTYGREGSSGNYYLRAAYAQTTRLLRPLRDIALGRHGRKAPEDSGGLEG